jgi:HTH-type transcriptional regulator, fmd operon transcriptional regulator
MLTEKEIQILLLRQEGLLQTEIAKRLNITQGAVSRFEANARAKIAEAKRQLELLRKFNIDVEESDPLEEKLKDLKRSLGGKR